MAAGLTWAYDSADSGDFLAAIATGGVPHPGGYPTYIFFASLFAKLPFGSLAYRTNLFSMLAMLLAIWIFYQLVEKITRKPSVALLSALIFGTFPLVWSQAIITEVYASLALLCALILFLLLPQEKPSAIKDFLSGLALGLAIGNHLTAVFLAPFLFLKNTQDHIREISLRLLGLLTGLSIFLSIPLRASNQAPINWGNAVTWDGFWWLVSGEMYQNRLSHFSFPYLYKATGLWSQFLIDQIGVIGLAIAFTYIIVFFKPTRLHFATLWLALVYSAFAILYYSPDSYVYLILPLFSFSIWMALGWDVVLENLPLYMRNKPIKLLMMGLPIVIIVLTAIKMVPQMDISTDHSAEEFATVILDSLPEKAIVVAQGDESLFSLWYFHYALGQRPDIAILSLGLFDYPWYQDQLQRNYPELSLPPGISVNALLAYNPDRPVCTLGLELLPKFDCFEEVE